MPSAREAFDNTRWTWLGFGLVQDERKIFGCRYAWVRSHAMHRWLCGTFGKYMSPRLRRHASMTACVYSLRMWAIVDAK
ncbi:unnamed protein product [Prunus armeniaca]